MKKLIISSMVGLVFLLAIVAAVCRYSGWWPFGKPDELDRIVEQSQTNGAAQAQIDAFTKTVEEGALDKTSKDLLTAQWKGIKAITNDSPDYVSQLIYCGVLIASGNGDWKAVGDFADYAQRNQLLDAKYGPAIALYAAELTVQSGDTLAAVATLKNLLNSSLQILWLPDRVTAKVARVAELRIRQLELGKREIWVVDSKPGRKGHDVEIASYLQANIGVVAEGKGKWGKPFLKNYVYYRTGENDLLMADIQSALGAKGIDVVFEHQMRSKSPTVHRLFKENEKLYFLVIRKK